MSRRRRAARAALRGAGALGLIGLAVLGLDALLPPDLRRAADTGREVVDAAGALLRPFPVEDGRWRLAARPAAVDPLYRAMLVAVEDRRFGWHPGVDPLAVARAAGQMIAAGRVVSGASTLTMQAARLLEPKPRTLGAKAVEALRALQLQARLGNDGVLGLYLTLAPFGGPLEGVRAGALAWFGKEPARLSPAEAALLVALPQSPERLRPDRFPQAARAARDRVLDRAAAAGLLTAHQVAAAKAQPVPTTLRPLPRHAAHLAENLAIGAPPGVVIATGIDGAVQRRLEVLGRQELARLGDDGAADLAVVMVRLRDRQVIGHLGSGDWQARPLDLTRAPRSPGSTLKPLIYALAFDDLSLHPATLVEDAPFRFGAYAPANFDQGFRGTVSVREALHLSLNIPAVQALGLVGPARLTAVLDHAGARLAFPAQAVPSLPLALGGVGVSLADLVMLYAALGDGGMARPLAWQATAGTPPQDGVRLVGPAAAWAVLDILDGTPPPDGRLAARLAAGARPVAYKTGTSYGFRDAWAVGVSGEYAVGVWVGRPDGAPRPGALGRVAAAPLLFAAFDLLPPDRTRRPPPPDPDHALLRPRPPAGLVHLRPPEEAARQARRPPLRILFPPDGAEVESLPEGIALAAAGGRPPLAWAANDLPLAAGAAFWQPDGAGFARLSVIDADGRRATATIRVAVPPAAVYRDSRR